MEKHFTCPGAQPTYTEIRVLLEKRK